MIVYNERFAIPQQVTYGFKDGKLAGELDRQGREGMVRELQLELLMNLETAERVHAWLGQKLENLCELKKKSGSPDSSAK